ncbi:hypothetical protein RXV95_07855 [Novosphingobium sp. ZN18A2]|uniref:hypothetical protein n=1 Tax=Novosphingobium sp. ZN18A2 TaxID=3079861 RepID=UPI0030CF657C
MGISPAERRDHDTAGSNCAPEADDLHKDVYLGLQICRASSLSLTRLQIALKDGDRHRVLDAVDRLHELDTRAGNLLENLPGAITDDPEWQAIRKYVEQQNMAVAFERLALASEVSGPDMVTPLRWPDTGDQSTSAEDVEPEPIGRRATVSKMIVAAIVLAAILALALGSVFVLTG